MHISKKIHGKTLGSGTGVQGGRGCEGAMFRAQPGTVRTYVSHAKRPVAKWLLNQRTQRDG